MGLSRGCISDIIRVIGVKKYGEVLKRHLEREKWLAYTEIIAYLSRGGFTEEEKKFEEIAEEILEKGYFSYGRDRKEYLDTFLRSIRVKSYGK